MSRLTLVAHRLAINGRFFGVFFTRSHGYITKHIGKYIDLFKQSKLTDASQLIRLRQPTFQHLTAAPHRGWQQAFRICKALDDNAVHAKGWFNSMIMFPTP